MKYGILDGNKEELKIDGKHKRISDYQRVRALYLALREVMICFLVRWDCDSMFTVLEG